MLRVRLGTGILAFGTVLTSAEVGAQGAPTSGTRPLSVEDLVTVRRSSRARLSPDGRYLLFTVETADLEQNRATSRVHVASTGSGAVTMLPEEVHAPEWLPDSRHLTHVRDDSTCTQLWTYDVASGAARPMSGCLPAAGSSAALRWSSDGRYGALLIQPRTANPALAGLDTLDTSRTGVDVGSEWMWGGEVASAALRWFATLPVPPAGQQLWVFDRRTERVWRVSDAAADVHDVDWAPDGPRLAWIGFTRRDSVPGIFADPEVAFGGDVGLVVTDAGSREDFQAVRLGHARGGTRLSVRWSPDARRLAVGGDSGLTVYPLRRGRDGASAGRRVYSNRVRGYAWSDDGRTLYATVYRARRQHLLAVDLTSGRERELFADLRWYQPPSFASDRRTFVTIVETVAAPPLPYLGIVGTAELRQVVPASILHPRLTDVAPLRYDTLTWRSRDDKWDIAGLLITATPAGAAGPLPLVVALRGAGEPADLAFGVDDHIPVLALAAAGYAVLVPNTRGRIGIGEGYDGLKAERTYFSKPWWDVMAGVDMLVNRGIADPERLGIIGFSWGGGLAAYGITQTARFTAAVLKEPAGIDDRAAFRASWGNPLTRKNNMSLTPVRSPYGDDSASLAWLRQESPIDHVHAVETPTLSEYGVKNLNGWYGNQFYQALQYFGVPSEFILYPRIAHAFAEPALLADSFRRELAWFDYWLLRKPYPNPKYQAVYDAWRRRAASRAESPAGGAQSPPPKPRPLCRTALAGVGRRDRARVDSVAAMLADLDTETDVKVCCRPSKTSRFSTSNWRPLKACGYVR